MRNDGPDVRGPGDETEPCVCPCLTVYHKISRRGNPASHWNIPTFEKRYRAPGEPFAVFAGSEGLVAGILASSTRNHPESTSNSIWRSPHSSLGQFGDDARPPAAPDAALVDAPDGGAGFQQDGHHALDLLGEGRNGTDEPVVLGFP